MTNTKLLVTIYCAENLISGKKYIGQTCRPLSYRKQQHYNHARMYNHKFATALKLYPKDSWNWYVLAVVERDKANEWERFFISDLDTYENGYNTQKVSSFENKIDSTKYSSKICSVYHPDYGVLSGTKNELARQHIVLEEVRKLISGRTLHIRGWVLAENKDRYEEITSTRNRYGMLVTLTHSVYGTHTLLQSEFVHKFGLNYSCIGGLISKRRKVHKGWVVESLSKELLETTTTSKLESSVISLYHKEHGEHTLTRKEFSNKFDLDIYALSDLEKQKQRSHKGWSLVKEEE